MADAVPEERQRVTLTKAHCETPAGHELIELLAELSADGNVTREEMERLCACVDFPALPFLYETIDQISADGEISEEELDRLARQSNACCRRNFERRRRRNGRRHAARNDPPI